MLTFNMEKKKNFTSLMAEANNMIILSSATPSYSTSETEEMTRHSDI